MLLRQVPHLVIVDIALIVDAVGHDMVVLSGKVHGGAVGQMPAVGQIHAQHGVPVLAQGLIDGVVGIGAAMGLHVGMVGPEQPAGPVAGQVFHHVHALAAAVVPLAGVALGILVGEHRARCGQHRLADKVLRRDQLDIAPLAVILGPDGRAHLRDRGMR